MSLSEAAEPLSREGRQARQALYSLQLDLDHRLHRAASGRARARTPATWNRWCCIELVTRYRRELGDVAERPRVVTHWIHSLKARLRTGQHRDGRPFTPRTLQAYAGELRRKRAWLAECRRALEALIAHPPLPYHLWRQDREACLRHQLTALHVDRA